MACEVYTIKECVFKGDSVNDRSINFDIDISSSLFVYETRNYLGAVVERKVSGNGIYNIGENQIIIECAGVEAKSPSVYHSALKCVDGDDVTTILAWETTVKKERVGNL